MKKLTFKVKLEGVPGMEVAPLRAPFDVVEVFGTRAREYRYVGRSTVFAIARR